MVIVQHSKKNLPNINCSPADLEIVHPQKFIN